VREDDADFCEIDRRFRDCFSLRIMSSSNVVRTAPQREAENHNGRCAEAFCCKFHAADLRERDDLSGNADDEEITQALVDGCAAPECQMPPWHEDQIRIGGFLRASVQVPLKLKSSLRWLEPDWCARRRAGRLMSWPARAPECSQF
jgi:hypothetical protein